MKFLPAELKDELSAKLKDNSECLAIMAIFQDNYKKVGFKKPWIAYFAANDVDEIVGGGGIKGQPKNGSVEISYGTFNNFEGQGVGTEICKQLVSLALQTESSVKITARTLPDNFASIRILERNGFECRGTVCDEEGGNVLEWIYKNSAPNKVWNAVAAKCLKRKVLHKFEDSFNPKVKASQEVRFYLQRPPNIKIWFCVNPKVSVILHATLHTQIAMCR